MDTLPVVPNVQVFATDIDDAALAVARAGRYPAQLLGDISPRRRERFFLAEPASCVLAKEVRDLCSFSAHSVIRDPPFSRMDFISCRNLLIYFSGDLQHNVLPLFHYSLKPGGFLFLGPAESLARNSDLFTVIDKKHRIFERRSRMNSDVRLPLWMAKGTGMTRFDTGSPAGLQKDQHFTDLGPPLTPEEAAQHGAAAVSHDVNALEQELRETRGRLQATIEEYETALEELKSGNEELVSVNEELQSTNEEMETSKEELQSVNEELQTVNQELASKVDELHRSNADLNNLFESTQIATVFLDRHMLIRSYTPAVTAIFNLIPGDRGRPLTDIAHQLEDVNLLADVREVLEQRKAIERPVRLREGKIFHLMRILPYRTSDQDVDGALITFVDVTAVAVAEEQQRLLVAELNHRVRNMLQVVIGLAHQTLHRTQTMEGFEKSFMGRMQALARAYELLSHDGWRKVPLEQLLHTQLGPFATEGQRYTCEGEQVVLTSNGALSLGLVIYELATNATKYGALSVPAGKVDVSWKLASNGDGQNEFLFFWRESGGPAVHAPARQGFGSELVQRQLHYELNGRASMDFESTGLQVTLAIPADKVVEAGNSRPVTRQ